jgi:hypothetical protein
MLWEQTTEIIGFNEHCLARYMFAVTHSHIITGRHDVALLRSSESEHLEPDAVLQRPMPETDVGQ